MTGKKVAQTKIDLSFMWQRPCLFEGHFAMRKEAFINYYICKCNSIAYRWFCGYRKPVNQGGCQFEKRGVVGSAQQSGRMRKFIFAMTALAHVVALGCLEVSAHWRVDELAAPPLHIQLAFFRPQLAKPLSAPPAQRRGGRLSAAPKPSRQPPPEVVVPDLMQPEERPPEESLLNAQEPLAEDLGTAAGVKGGVAVGAIEGAVKEVAPSASPAAVPLVVSGAELAKQCLSCPAPSLLPQFRKSGAVVAMKLRLCLDALGSISLLEILEGVAPFADQAVLATVKSWRYSPYQSTAGPHPVCARLHFAFLGRQ